MALLKIARMGHPVLRRKADPVRDLSAPALLRLVEDMIETMLDAPGVGLAAPQVFASTRVIVFRVPAARAGSATSVEPSAIINPALTPLEPDLVPGWEGCLSIPGLRGIVPRYRRILVRGSTLEGEAIETEATGFEARVIQHEVDHLDGILFLERMTDLRMLTYEAEMRYFNDDFDT